MQLVWQIPTLLIIAALVSGLGSLSGVGGGVLFVPILLLLLKSNSVEEIKFLSTLLVFASAAINVGFNLFKKSISYKVILVGIVFSLPMVFLGNYVVTLFNADILKLIIGFLLLVVGGLLVLVEYFFKNRTLKKINENQVISGFRFIKVNDESYISSIKLITIAMTGGFVTSLTGMGGGPILMPFLLIWCKLSMKQASPISHALIAGSSLIALLTNYQNFENFELLVPIGLPMIIGVISGTILALILKKYLKKEIYIKWVLIILIWLSAIKMIVDFFI
ncbi:sulfite exporter TauE/SafE family protein [Spiroplasma endosymbiont of Panorpa germanica]|uniref:sulfite exporter TauE/SafE family protein n=1 Tax=Spiroplasma endosymbiont of Panorpa germanica TaxID=3066314 RepID=UPI0030CB6D45